MIALDRHPEARIIRVQLRQNLVLKHLNSTQRQELESLVSNAQGKEMILRFAAESDIDTSYAAWRLKTPIPYSIRTVTKVRVAKLSMQHWAGFLESHPAIKQAFEFELMKLMSEVMAHTITLHLLDAPGRIKRFMRKHDDLADRLPKKELALYLNLSPETLSRLKRHGKT